MPTWTMTLQGKLVTLWAAHVSTFKLEVVMSPVLGAAWRVYRQKPTGSYVRVADGQAATADDAKASAAACVEGFRA